MEDPAQDVTQLLQRWAKGDRQALDRLMPLVYGELRRLANFYLQRERSDHTLQPTALVHEAYLRLVGQRNSHWQNRAQFYGVAAQIMRRILVDHARQHQAEKRKAMKDPLPLDDALTVPAQVDLNLVELDRSLEALAEFDPEKCRLVELRFFVGLNVEDTAEVLGVSPATVKREWAIAKAWLHQRRHRVWRRAPWSLQRPQRVVAAPTNVFTHRADLTANVFRGGFNYRF